MRDERTIYTTVVDFGFVFTPQAISLVQPDSYILYLAGACEHESCLARLRGTFEFLSMRT